MSRAHRLQIDQRNVNRAADRIITKVVAESKAREAARQQAWKDHLISFGILTPAGERTDKELTPAESDESDRVWDALTTERFKK